MSIPAVAKFRTGVVGRLVTAHPKLDVVSFIVSADGTTCQSLNGVCFLLDGCNLRLHSYNLLFIEFFRADIRVWSIMLVDCAGRGVF